MAEGFFENVGDALAAFKGNASKYYADMEQYIIAMYKDGVKPITKNGKVDFNLVEAWAQKQSKPVSDKLSELGKEIVEAGEGFFEQGALDKNKYTLTGVIAAIVGGIFLLDLGPVGILMLGLLAAAIGSMADGNGSFLGGLMHNIFGGKPTPGAGDTPAPVKAPPLIALDKDGVPINDISKAPTLITGKFVGDGENQKFQIESISNEIVAGAGPVVITPATPMLLAAPNGVVDIESEAAKALLKRAHTQATNAPLSAPATETAPSAPSAATPAPATPTAPAAPTYPLSDKVSLTKDSGSPVEFKTFYVKKEGEVWKATDEAHADAALHGTHDILGKSFTIQKVIGRQQNGFEKMPGSELPKLEEVPAINKAATIISVKDNTLDLGSREAQTALSIIAGSAVEKQINITNEIAAQEQRDIAARDAKVKDDAEAKRRASIDARTKLVQIPTEVDKYNPDEKKNTLTFIQKGQVDGKEYLAKFEGHFEKVRDKIGFRNDLIITKGSYVLKQDEPIVENMLAGNVVYKDAKLNQAGEVMTTTSGRNSQVMRVDVENAFKLTAKTPSPEAKLNAAPAPAFAPKETSFSFTLPLDAITPPSGTAPLSPALAAALNLAFDPNHVVPTNVEGHGVSIGGKKPGEIVPFKH